MLFIVGQHGCGKTESSKILSKLGFLCIDLGPIIRLIYKRDTKKLTINNWIKQGESKFGKRFSDIVLVNEINAILKNNIDGYSGIVILGSRSIAGVNYISKNISDIFSHHNMLAYIEVKEHILYQRYNKREGTNYDLKEFQDNILGPEKQMGVKKLRRIANIIIDNNKDIDHFKSEIIKLVANYLSK